MFVRFRQSTRRLQLSLVENRRLSGKIHHEHIAGLGSIAVPPSVADRIAYWQQLHERLGQLSNRLDPETQGKILTAVHARIPMPTIEERRALQLEYTEADERFWSTLQGMHQGTVEDHKGLVAKAERAIAAGQTGATHASKRAAAAKDRVAGLKAGEDVPVLGTRPMTQKEIIAAASLTPSEVRRAIRVHELYEVGAWEEFLAEIFERTERGERAALRSVYRRHFPYTRRAARR
jgi:hypothetical protein